MSSSNPLISMMTTPPSLTLSASPTGTLSEPLPTVTNTNSNYNSNSGGGGTTQNSPLLFFVALGFGVVFTNLWIIVGVKYCFRYNARNRARANGLDDVDLQAMGGHPRRRRREKKLMTVDEVNERFPVTKYKTWRANREVLGLPTAGGIAADGAIPVTNNTITTAVNPPASPLPKVPEPVADPTKPALTTDSTKDDSAAKSTTTTPSAEIRRPELGSQDDDRDEDEAVAAVPAEVANPGDTCAICIDNLEDSDDIRGLTCGHAFHTACIDPWLTSRRASCPLCKADYYVPRARTEAEIEADEAARERRRQAAAEVHRHPLTTWWYRAETYLMPPIANPVNNRSRQGREDTRRRSAPAAQYNGSRWNPFSHSRSNSNTNAGAGTSPEITQSNSQSVIGRFRRHSRTNSRATAPNAPAENPTPSTLEAGLAESNTNTNAGSR